MSPPTEDQLALVSACLESGYGALGILRELRKEYLLSLRGGLMLSRACLKELGLRGNRTAWTMANNLPELR